MLVKGLVSRTYSYPFTSLSPAYSSHIYSLDKLPTGCLSILPLSILVSIHFTFLTELFIIYRSLKYFVGGEGNPSAFTSIPPLTLCLLTLKILKLFSLNYRLVLLVINCLIPFNQDVDLVLSLRQFSVNC